MAVLTADSQVEIPRYFDIYTIPVAQTVDQGKVMGLIPTESK